MFSLSDIKPVSIPRLMLVIVRDKRYSFQVIFILNKQLYGAFLLANLLIRQ